jgi:predicted transcriptional regulator YdeE/DNA-binding transcriptional MerR regulator
MLKIGDFSRVAHVTVKALRHYGRMGLLRPVWVDRFSAYRYYALDQLPRLNRILALKELGFSLEQIAGMLDRNLEADELRSILHQKQVELEERLQAEQSRLTRVEARLDQIEKAGGLSDYEVVLKSVPDRCVVSMREVVADAESAPRRSMELCLKLLDDLPALGLRPSGPWLTVSYNPEYTDRNLDLEVAVMVDMTGGGGASRRARRGAVHMLAGSAQMACVVHSSPVCELTEAYGALYTWLEANCYHQAGPLREVHHTDPHKEGAAVDCSLIELQMPVEKPVLSKSNPKSLLTQQESPMEPKFVTKPAMMLVGMKYVGKNQHAEIGEMWGRFNPLIPQLTSEPIQAAYGWCGMPDEQVEEGAFEYVAAVEMNRADNLPDWAVVRMIPESTYAVFPHVGPVEGLKNTYNEIYQAWLPQSGYEPSSPFDMEVYTDEFHGFTPDSVMYIYLPVKKK